MRDLPPSILVICRLGNMSENMQEDSQLDITRVEDTIRD